MFCSLKLLVSEAVEHFTHELPVDYLNPGRREYE